MTMATRTTTAIRFPADLHAELARAAEERGVSINRIVCEAVEEFLPRLKPPADLRLARPPAMNGRAK
jgi:hypothetical protein